MESNFQKTTLNSLDEGFIKSEAFAAAATFAVAELGVKKAKHIAVKGFSNTLIFDLSAENTELKTLATQKGVDISGIHAEAKDIYKLETYHGVEFDKKFLTQIISGHKKWITAIETGTKGTECIELKAWSSKILPTLEAHLARAESLTWKLPSVG